MNEVLRQEKKYLISLDMMYDISEKVSEVMHMDQHGTSDGYLIRSLYFDSIDERDYTEKGDGIELRRKLRLRNYGAQNDFAMLEMKQKQGANQKKRSLRLTRGAAKRLIDADYSVLLEQNNVFATECYYVMTQHLYRPKCVVTYNRKAFVARENSIRITFDHHIRGSESNFNIFDERINENYIMDPYLVVMEVKFNGFLLSYIKDVINCVESSETSVSKYYMGRSRMMNALL